MSTERFFDRLIDSGLMSADEVRALRDSAPRETLEGRDAQEFARELVTRKKLTPWQAGMLLAGRDAFFLGRYKLLDQLGEGGMGTVFRAEQTPLGRIVALKVLSPAILKDPSAVARFRREIQAAAALSHPNVITVFDAESFRENHFLVMEYVAGKDLSQYATDGRVLPVGWACECIRQAALGLQHAHERGMVHRDIKPANLLVVGSTPATTGPDGVALPGAESQYSVKILDLGLARFVSESTDERGLTGVGEIMGTPDYISPEQARDTHSADIRSDVFSLGCTLFRLLTGRVPFEGRTIVEKLLLRTTHDAPRLAGLTPDAPPGLDAVVARMLARDPALRYQTPWEAALALAPYCTPLKALPSMPVAATTTTLSPRELELTSVLETDNPALDNFLRTLAHAPIEESFSPATLSNAAGAARLETLAHPDRRRGAPTGVTVRRRRSIAGVAIPSTVAAAMLIAAGWGAWQAFARGSLIIEWRPEERTGGVLTIDERDVSLPPDESIQVPVRPGKHRLHLVRPGYEPLDIAANVRRGVGTPVTIDWRPKSETRRRQEWSELERAIPADTEPANTLRASTEPLAAKLREFRVRWPGTLESLKTAQKLTRFQSPLDSLAASDLPKTERQDWHPPELIAVFGETPPGHNGSIHAVAFRPDGRQIASCGADGVMRLWEPATMQLQFEISRNTRALAYTADSRFLIAGGPGAVFYDVSGQEPVECVALSEFEGPVGAIVVSPDDRTLVLIDAKVRLFDLTVSPPQEQSSFPVDSWGTGAAFTPDSRTLITFSGQKTIKLWNLDRGKPPELRARLEAHGAPADGDYVCGVVVSGDGKRMVSSGVWDWTFFTWDLEPAVPRDPIGFHHSTAPSVIVRAPDARSFAVGCWDGAVYLFDLTVSAPPPFASLKGHAGQVWGAAFSPDSKQLVSGGADGILRLWNIDGNASDERELPHVGHRRLVSGVAFSPDATKLYSTSHDGRAVVWDVATRRPLQQLFRAGGPILASALSPDGRLLAVGDSEQAAIQLVDIETAETRQTIHGMAWPATFRFSPDGRRLAAPVGQTVRSWDVAGGDELPAVGWHSRPVAAFAFLPDGNTLVAGIKTAEYTPPATSDILRWEIATGKERESFRGDKACYGVLAMDCSPDGKTIAVALQPSGMMMRDVDGVAAPAATIAGPTITALEFSPDGRHLVTLAAGNFMVTLRHPKTGAEIKSWRLPSGPQSLVFSPDSRHIALGNTNGTICILRVD